MTQVACALPFCPLVSLAGKVGSANSRPDISDVVEASPVVEAESVDAAALLFLESNAGPRASGVGNWSMALWILSKCAGTHKSQKFLVYL